MAGSGLDVWEVVETVAANDWSIAGAAAYLAVDPSLVATAMRYYAAHPDEIDAWIAADQELADREYALYVRQRQPRP